ncbi:Short-chain dehydrogenase [Fibrobacter sp. UWH9]|uniref:SDR family NAD(P)-dependent oxidoreductase n=1 Tax=unclassified Fibrobacter TaxID=2634177 RepID=UPI000919F65C|nr:MULTISPECIES: SDR family oxidoreductase [Fibrobacter]MCQ2099505.1 SDR family oxidoreductase [Fibrobacter sp.]MCL4101475.1 3-phenylpropionate-dihydrodiol/cinnamic acid-dihydrodiol dehydrogenase [Fibrobacter succinogenes]MDO4946951.1 SDR family oxidoreductase [Fibrobacter sp.]OWV15898.1 short-chain dehydrogenase [Fibrobacter sp. UWH1]SHG81214.1 Short-chain dehydrogenase [Fibrobacter sp. UWH9]
MIDVKGKWTLITGGCRGVGRLTAIEMAKLGANIILQGRCKANADKVIEELKPYGVEVRAVGCNLESESEIDAALAEIDSWGVQVDLVFNNAGLMSHYFQDYLSNTMEDFHHAMAVNFYAPIKIAYHFLPGMIKRGFGRMQLTTSGIANEPELMGYACAKAALTKFVKDFAVKLNGTDVMMNVMDPGWLRTDLGGPAAPNAPETVIPGSMVGVLLDDKKSGRWFSAQEFTGMSLEDAVKKGADVQ